MAVAPAPASTADSTASLAGRVRATRSVCKSTPAFSKVASNTERVPEPRSRSTQALVSRSCGVSGGLRTQGWPLPTTTTMWSAPITSRDRAGSSISPSTSPSSAVPARTCSVASAVLPMATSTSTPG